MGLGLGLGLANKDLTCAESAAAPPPPLAPLVRLRGEPTWLGIGL